MLGEAEGAKNGRSAWGNGRAGSEIAKVRAVAVAANLVRDRNRTALFNIASKWKAKRSERGRAPEMLRLILEVGAQPFEC